MKRSRRRVPLLWHVSYGNKDRAGVGTVVDIHEDGCRIAGSLPVKVGLRLHLCLWPTQYPKETLELRGTVKWTNGLQFGLAFDTPQISIPALLDPLKSDADLAPLSPPVVERSASRQRNGQRRSTVSAEKCRTFTQEQG
jgi:PilZ domain-containing protein